MKKYLIVFTALLVSGLIATIGFAGDRQIAKNDGSSGYSVVKVVNKDQFQGRWKEFKGELKKKWGKFTDDDLLQIEGDYDKFEGKLQKRYGDRREEVKRWTDEWFETHDAQGRPRNN